MKSNMRSNKYVILTIVIVAILIIVLGPLILEYAFFRNNIQSVLSNAEWGSFLGSFIGGVLGGAGTLIAVYVSLNHTMRLQDKMEERIKQDKLDEELNRRRLFSEGVAEDVARFIESANKLYHSNLISNDLINKKNVLIERLDECDRRILELIKERKKYSRMVSAWRTFAHSTEISLIKDEMDENISNKSIFQRDLYEVREQINNYTTDDSNLTNSFYLLEIKLNDIKEAASLLSLIKNVKTECYNVNESDDYWINDQIDRITNYTKKFINTYCAMT